MYIHPLFSMLNTVPTLEKYFFLLQEFKGQKPYETYEST